MLVFVMGLVRDYGGIRDILSHTFSLLWNPKKGTGMMMDVIFSCSHRWKGVATKGYVMMVIFHSVLCWGLHPFLPQVQMRGIHRHLRLRVLSSLRMMCSLSGCLLLDTWYIVFMCYLEYRRWWYSLTKSDKTESLRKGQRELILPALVMTTLSQVPTGTHLRTHADCPLSR